MHTLLLLHLLILWAQCSDDPLAKVMLANLRACKFWKYREEFFIFFLIVFLVYQNRYYCAKSIKLKNVRLFVVVSCTWK